MNKMIEVKEAIYTLKKHIGLQGILCNRVVLDCLVSSNSDACWDMRTAEEQPELDEFSELTLFGVRCKSSRLFGFTERYSDV